MALSFLLEEAASVVVTNAALEASVPPTDFGVSSAMQFINENEPRRRWSARSISK
jgi:hypothetical protein